ncbi:MAG: bifunctional phosphoglucose/phosphomannose isomerase, partial [Bacteroidia bacterium]|nr:bifunctional phosphoglucose/phosphomannose isomerase [Bacteroidia bacterium]
MQMFELIRNFPNQLEEAIQIGQTIRWQSLNPPFQNLVILGLGGSAFGGEVIKNYCFNQCPIPIQICRGYEIPSYVSEQSLIIASSYSGNTEETLATLYQAIQKKAQIICITSGGKVAELAKQHEFTCIQLPTGYPPRTAAGFSIVQQLFILHHFGLINDFLPDLKSSIIRLQNFNQEHFELARWIAKECYKKIPVVYASDLYESVAVRFRQQIEENAKQLCWHHLIPEMNHNELVGWELPQDLLKQLTVIFFRSQFDHERVAIRMDINRNLIRPKASKVIEIYPEGNNLLETLFYFLHLSDWVSYEL